MPSPRLNPRRSMAAATWDPRVKILEKAGTRRGSHVGAHPVSALYKGPGVFLGHIGD